jgi:hypothetical protein
MRPGEYGGDPGKVLGVKRLEGAEAGSRWRNVYSRGSEEVVGSASVAGPSTQRGVQSTITSLLTDSTPIEMSMDLVASGSGRKRLREEDPATNDPDDAMGNSDSEVDEAPVVERDRDTDRRRLDERPAYKRIKWLAVQPGRKI